MSAEETQSVTLEQLIIDGIVTSDGSNAKSLHCKLCNEPILGPDLGFVVQKKILLHKDHHKQDEDFELEECEWHFVVNDMWTFTNLGVTRAVSSDGQPFRYLICGGCDQGIYGKQIEGENEYFVSINRVAHV